MYKIRDVSLTAVPGTISEGETADLAATATLDDSTSSVVEPVEAAWGIVSGPIGSISNDGIVQSVPVYQDSVGEFSGFYAGITAFGSLLVLNTDPDNFGDLAGDGFNDRWEVLWGLNDPLVPGEDLDRDGITNLLEYALNMDPL